MNKKIVCFLLALVMVLGLFPTTVVTASAASKLSTSDKAIDVLKEYIEFKEEPEKEGGKWYIGYGTEISETDAANKYLNGITEDDALVLLKRKVASGVDTKLNEFTKKNNLDLTQYEHDALALFSYNMGIGWTTDSSSAMYQAVRTGKTGMNFVNVIASESNVGFDVSDGEAFHAALNRRLSEANMYLNNSYGYYTASQYTYVVLDVDGDEKFTSACDTYLLYDSSIAQSLKEVPTYSAAPGPFIGWYEFDGKVDNLAGGAPVAYLDEDTAGVRLVAKYYTGNASGSNAPENANYTMSVSLLENVYLFNSIQSRQDMSSMGSDGYKTPESYDDYIGYVTGDYFYVTKEAVVDDMYWVYGYGKTKGGSWIEGWLYTGEVPEWDDEDSVGAILATATVTAATLKVYEGATEDSDVITTLSKGQVVNIYDVKVEKTDYGNKTWGKVNYLKGNDRIIGWINLAYTDTLEYSGGSDSAEGRKATVINTDLVNVRKEASVNSAKITSLAYGTEVTVKETKMNGNAEWAKVTWDGLRDGYSEGWVYIYYLDVEGLEHTQPDSETTGTILYTGVVSSNINLNVRKEPKVTAATNGNSLPNGTKVNIYEVKTAANGVKWGRIGEKKWVCLQYVTLTEADNSGSNGTTTTTELQATVNITSLDVLKNYNNNAAKVGTLKKGDVVTILEKNTEKTETGSRVWGRIKKDNLEGWINLAYVDLKTVTSVSGGSTSNGSTGTNANGANAVISNCISVNVREGAGVTKALIVKLNNGTAVKVYEQITKDNAPWARITWNNGTKEGWVCMNYVTMAAPGTDINTNGSTVNGTNSNTISATGTVNSNIALKVRAGAGLGYAQIGSLAKGTKVTIYEQVTNDGMIWGRMPYGTGSGYVCMSYITVDNTSVTGKGVMGTIARCFNAVNVRSAPGTGNALVGTIGVGNRVEVFETREHANQLWGRVAQGWICMDYVLLDSQLPPGTALDATQPTTEATTEATAAPTINKDDEVQYYITGTISVSSGDSEAYEKDGVLQLKVRNDASSSSDRVGAVNNGMPLTILAVKSNGAKLWGRIDQYATAGWVNMDYVIYGVHGYVNTEDQPIFADPDTTSTVKGRLAINKELNITKLTVNGNTVFGWVEEGLNGWIPMGRINDEPVKVTPTYKSTLDKHTVQFFRNISGITNGSLTAYNEPNGKTEKFYLTNGVTVYIDDIDYESGKLWGEVTANGVTAWINLASVTYTIDGTTVKSLKVYASNSTSSGTYGNVDGAITLCELRFDGDGNLWGKVTANSNADVNGGYVMIRSCDTLDGIQTFVDGIISK